MGTKKFLLKQLIDTLPSYCNFMLNIEKKPFFIYDLNFRCFK